METFDFTINSFLSFTNKGNDSSNLTELASHIMTNYCIYNGRYHYRPVEIEFYVYKKGEHEDRHVYPRIKNAKDIFFHYSGMDICFKTSENKDCLGGILIRALERDEDKQLFGGPLVCLNEVLNTAVLNTATGILIVKEEPVKEPKNAKPFGQRVGINALPNIEDIFYKKEYRFIRSNLNEKSTFGLRTTYNYSNQEFKEISNSYKLKRYTPKQ